MRRMHLLRSLPLLILGAACTNSPPPADPLLPTAPFEIRAGQPVEALPTETHLRNVRQLTFEGQNAEAYWSHDGRRLILQRRIGEGTADQIYTLDLTTGDLQLVSTGQGATTCSYFMKGDRQIVYASTHHHGAAAP